jgi:hypothetical protein
MDIIQEILKPYTRFGKSRLYKSSVDINKFKPSG